MNALRLVRNRLKARSIHYAFVRLINIARHYGITPYPFEPVLDKFISAVQEYGVRVTFPVTAIVLHRHSGLFRRLQDRGVEFAIHGYRHIDHTQLTSDQMHCHLEKAKTIFRQNGIRYQGFRFPFLRRNAACTRIVNEHMPMWESSEVIVWPLPDLKKISKTRCSDYETLVESYQAADSDSTESLPYSFQGGLQIPVSIPDDDLLIERLALGESEVLRIWQHILRQCHERGELFVMQLHPERFLMFRRALGKILEEALSEKEFWITSLDEIAVWWKKRTAARIEVNSVRRGEWKFEKKLPLCFRIYNTVNNRIQWTVLESGMEIVKADQKPVIGLTPPVSQELIDILTQEGYLFEDARARETYSVRISGASGLEKRTVLEQIESSKQPLLKICRWPARYRAALALTGDIDGIDFWDYWTRFYGT